MKYLNYLFSAVVALTLTACGDGVSAPEVTAPSTVIGTADTATCTPEGVCTEEEKASWLAVKRAQCLRLGGAYCR